ncbi:FAD-dependent monooxygenase [Nannocystis pusilla]|uniref:FAD-dependent monooxygenase n=1 Tax=Nannocystis pusilla TaxID=889268 RepID=A0ABS7TVI5_9BACT|nr:FAD-dependent monooxygenase [Nannocystis pusilla]
MKHTKILISGASIAGPALAYWLRRHGFHPTVVERAPAIRGGGQAIDVRGAALDVVERMGLLAQVRGASTRMRGMSFVDAEGRELMRTTEATLTGGKLDSPDVELMRDDLARLLYDATRDDVEYVFDDTITALAQDDDGVDVRFARGEPRRFDLVIGADGLHSTTRRLVFGEESRFIRHLGTWLAIFSVENFLELDHWQVFHDTDEAMVGIYSARDNREARAMLGFSSPPLEFDPRDVARQQQLVAERLAGVGWVAPRLLAAMATAPDFYFDSMSQIELERWSQGRVALVGDAACCSSPMSGQGSSVALVGAYVLAGELAAAGGDHRRGFAGYEAALRGYVAQNQQLALLAVEQRRPPAPEAVQRAAAVALRAYGAPVPGDVP